MLNFRIIARILGLQLIFEGLFMLLPAMVSFLYHEQTMTSFVFSALITIITGILVYTPLRNEERVYRNKEGYIIAVGIWIILSLTGTLPYILSGSIKQFGDAFFESMSGFTTTGATIFNDVESLTHGILFWRSLTQWLGGICIILISMSAFPVFKSANVQLSISGFSGHSADKIHPRIKDAAKRLISIYCLLTLSEIFLLIIGGMPVFDAVCQSLSTLSTGGFTTRNNGIASFSSPYIIIILTIFMFVAGTNLSLMYFGLKGNFRKITGNNEFIYYTAICLFFTAIVAVILIIESGLPIGKAVLNGAFHVISIITTTGFYSQNLRLTGNAILIIFIMLMFIGGTIGSTSGGIKIVRLLMVARNCRQELRRLIHPNGFIPVRLDKHIVPQNIIFNILIFTIIYIFLTCLGTIVISFMGCDILTSFTTSASMIGNIGPALGTSGPFTNYSDLPVAGKWFLSALMLLGRLEFLSLMILFTKNFYRR
jgi:trk system potassium uptake protein